MTTDEIMKRLNEVFAEVMENPTIQISKATTSADVPEWDSLNHIMLVVEIEKAFGIQFASGEVNGFRNVGEMAESIRKKLG